MVRPREPRRLRRRMACDAAALPAPACGGPPHSPELLHRGTRGGLEGPAPAAALPRHTPGAGATAMPAALCAPDAAEGDRKSTRLNSSHSQISYAVFCLKKKKKT